jgi:hypothetical protein
VIVREMRIYRKERLRERSGGRSECDGYSDYNNKKESSCTTT